MICQILGGLLLLCLPNMPASGHQPPPDPGGINVACVARPCLPQWGEALWTSRAT